MKLIKRLSLFLFLVQVPILSWGQVALASEDDPCLEVLDGDTLDQYDEMVGNYLEAAAASDSVAQAEILSQLMGICDQNLRLTVFRANAHAINGDCDAAVADYQQVMESAKDWPHPANAQSAISLVEKGIASQGANCAAKVEVTCGEGEVVRYGASSGACPTTLLLPVGKVSLQVEGANGSRSVEKEVVKGQATLDASGGGGGTLVTPGGGGTKPGGNMTNPGDGKKVVRKPTTQPQPTGMPVKISLSAHAGGAGGEVETEDDPIELEGGGGGGVQVGATAKFIPFMALGLNFHYVKSTHEEKGYEGEYEISSPSFGLLGRMDYAPFALTLWLNYVAGGVSGQMDEIEGMSTDITEQSGFEFGFAGLYVMDFGSIDIDLGLSLFLINAEQKWKDHPFGYWEGGRTNDSTYFFLGATLGATYEFFL